MAQRKKMFEAVVHGVFLLLGLITVGCVLLITVYLVISGIPAIQKIGLVPFLTGKVWSSTSAEPKYGILPFILTSVYGTAGAIVLGVPIGFLTAVYLSKVAPKKVRTVLEAAVQPARGDPVGRVRPCRYDGARACHPQDVPPAGRRKPVCGHHRAGRHDPAVDHQGERHGARGRSA